MEDWTFWVNVSIAGWVKHTKAEPLLWPCRDALPAQTSSRQTWWIPSVSAPPPGTAAPGTHASLEPDREDESKKKWDGEGSKFNSDGILMTSFASRTLYTCDVLQSRSLILSLMTFINDVML